MSVERYDLPPGWEWTTLGECVEVLDSRRVPVNAEEREERNAGKSSSELYPYFGATGQVGWIDDFIFDDELLLLGEDGAPFLDPYRSKAYLVRGRCWVNNHAHVLRAQPGMLVGEYLCHYLNIFDYQGFVTGTTRLKLNQGKMLQIAIPLPPLPEQRRIVARIEALFAHIRAAREALDGISALFRHFRQAVLAAAFRGDLTSRYPDDEPAAVLLERIRAERHRKWEADLRAKGKDLAKYAYEEPALPDTSNLPELPEGWVWASLETLAWDAGYGTSLKCNYGESSAPVIRIPNIIHGRFDLTDIKYALEPEALDASRALQTGDLVIVRTNGSKSLIGRGALVREAFERPHFFASYLIRYRLIECSGLPQWVETLWESPFVRDWIERIAATSAGQYNISVGNLNRLPLPLPPASQQQEISQVVEVMVSHVNALAQAATAAHRQLDDLEQAILARAFRGELVPQDPSDEPASALLERIRAEREANQGVPIRRKAR